MSLLQPVDGDKLAQTLVSKWVAQRSESLGEKIDGESELAYDGARELEEFDRSKRKDLFVEQAAFAWSRLGIDVDVPFELLRGRYRAVESLPAAVVAKTLDGIRVPIKAIASPAVFARNLPAASGMPPSTGVGENLTAAAREQSFDMSCTLRLTWGDEDSVSLESLAYELTPKAGYEGDAEGSSLEDPGLGFIRARAWSEAIGARR